MRITNLEWHTHNGGETWTLSGFVSGADNQFRLRKMFDVTYMGRTLVAFGGGRMRWKIQDRRYWIDNPEDIPEFNDLDEAKAWVLSIITLEN